MNVWTRLTGKTLKANRTRTAVTIVGIVLAAAMLTAVTTFISSLRQYLIANIIADIIIRLFDQLDEHLEQGGTLLTSGIIEDRIEDVLAAAEKHGYGVVERLENKGWACITFKRKIDM